VLSVLIPLAACGDDFGPGDWSAIPDTTVIYSASRPELIRQPSAFDIVNLQRVAIEGGGATGNWDMALIEDGGFQLAPETSITGSGSRSGIAPVSETNLADVVEAPGDTAAYLREPVAIRDGAIYVVRSRRVGCFTGGTGVYYAKLQAIAVDPVAGTFEFAVVRNPNCNNRALIPPQD
jgi:hypothetical protein